MAESKAAITVPNDIQPYMAQNTFEYIFVYI